MIEVIEALVQKDKRAAQQRDRRAGRPRCPRRSDYSDSVCSVREFDTKAHSEFDTKADECVHQRMIEWHAARQEKRVVTCPRAGFASASNPSVNRVSAVSGMRHACAVRGGKAKFTMLHEEAALKIQSILRGFFARWPPLPAYLPWLFRVHWRRRNHLKYNAV